MYATFRLRPYSSPIPKKEVQEARNLHVKLNRSGKSGAEVTAEFFFLQKWNLANGLTFTTKRFSWRSIYFVN